MTNLHILSLYKQAEATGIITNLKSYAECSDWFESNSNSCEGCIAEEACKVLSNGRADYEIFKLNFNNRIRPLLHLTLSELRQSNPEYFI